MLEPRLLCGHARSGAGERPGRVREQHEAHAPVAVDLEQRGALRAEHVLWQEAVTGGAVVARLAELERTRRGQVPDVEDGGALVDCSTSF
jgi:hypothetical protein